ncbi:MAG: hypothetical protein U0Z26_17190 [Anaerolineales bacterium]
MKFKIVFLGILFLTSCIGASVTQPTATAKPLSTLTITSIPSNTPTFPPTAIPTISDAEKYGLMSLHVVISDLEVHGHGNWPSTTEVTLTIDDDTNEDNGVLYTSTQTPDGDSTCGTPCFDLRGKFTLRVGQFVTFTYGDHLTKTVHISRLQITSVNSKHDTVSGIADPGSQVAVNIWSQDGKARVVTTDENGNWVADFSVRGDDANEQFTTNITHGDNGRAIQLNPDGSDDGTLQYWSVP